MSKVELTVAGPATEPIELYNLETSRSPEAQYASSSQHDSATPQYPRGIRFIMITTGLILSIFVAALDSTIISTAIPSITTEFGSIANIAWYGSAYIVMQAAWQPVWGKAYHYFPLKTTFLLSILVFEVGNVICATAPSSEILIFGRVIAGTGSGGIFSGAFISIALTAGPDRRAGYMGLVSMAFGSASVIGPLMGGALTDGPGWRYIFWYVESIVDWISD
jgi:MFS family permease